MYDLLKKNKLFLIFYCLIIAAALIPVFLYTKTDLHLLVNRFHSRWADFFFKYVTFFGSGFFAGIVCIIFLFIRIRYSLIILAAWAGSGIVVQLLKHLVFPGFDRPVKVFGSDSVLHLVQGIEYHSRFSFPSGHAATAMAVFGFLALIYRRQSLKLMLLFCAAVVAYSRVYLSQHFLEDVIFGSVPGLLAVMIFYWYFHRLKIVWADHPVQYYIRQKQ
jgi:membrane-associated phospholipid phosphatase